MAERILILRLSSIGDIVLCTPAVRCLHDQLGAEIHWLVRKNFAPVIEANPYIHRIWYYEEVFSREKETLFDVSFTRIFDMHGNFRTRNLRRRWKGAKVLTFDKVNWQKWVRVRLKWDFLPEKHLIDRYFDALKSWNVVYDGKGMDFFLHGSDKTAPTHDYVAIVLGAAHHTKQMPEVLLQKVITLMNDRVVLVGGAKEKHLGDRLADLFPDQVVNRAGDCSIEESAWLIKHALRVISPDTGMMHIAAALGKSIDVVWGNTIPEFGMYPFYREGTDAYYRNHEVAVACRPCSKIGYEKCPKGHHRCMLLQSVDEMAVSELPLHPNVLETEKNNNS